VRAPVFARRKTLVALFASLGALSFADAASAEHIRGGDLLPDLETRPPVDLRTTTEGGRRLLRFTNRIPNRHSGVLEARPTAGGDCDGDGNANNNRLAYQRVFRDANGDGVFIRGTDTSYRSVSAGCMVFHPAHNHWHFNDFAKYELKSESTRQVVRASTKVGFCMIDSARLYPTVPGSPSSPFYNYCGQTTPMGISIGWADIYTWDLSGQHIDVTGLASGYYCLISTADPANRLLESDNSDNAGRIRLQLTSSSVTRLGSCPVP
jgi:hypothetical protein